MPYYEARICEGCKKHKDGRAFVGYRLYCRLCWLDLSPEQKEEELICSPYRSSEDFNKRAWAREKSTRAAFAKSE
jgi:hypothetical protein